VAREAQVAPRCNPERGNGLWELAILTAASALPSYHVAFVVPQRMEMIRRDIATNLFLSLKNLQEALEDFYGEESIPGPLHATFVEASNARRFAEIHGIREITFDEIFGLLQN